MKENYQYQPPSSDHELVNGAFTNNNRNEIMDIINRGNLEEQKRDLEYFKYLSFKEGSLEFSPEIIELENEIKNSEQFLKDQETHTKLSRKYEKFPFSNEEPGIN